MTNFDLALGCTVLATRMGVSPAYVTANLPAWLIGGVGVGLALPNLMAGSTHDLPASMAATGSGVVTMARRAPPGPDRVGMSTGDPTQPTT